MGARHHWPGYRPSNTAEQDRVGGMAGLGGVIKTAAKGLLGPYSISSHPKRSNWLSRWHMARQHGTDGYFQMCDGCGRGNDS